VGEYPLILSIMIKVSWIFIIQHALDIIRGIKEGDSNDLKTSSKDKEDKGSRKESKT
jgi:hypothetical protein